MLGFLFGGPEREARQLNRDAPAIIDNAQRAYPSEVMREIASRARRALEEARERMEVDQDSREWLLGHFKSLHREARRENRQLELTAYTLVIIHLRAQALGEAGAPARQAIEEFLDAWAHAIDPAETGDG